MTDIVIVDSCNFIIKYSASIRDDGKIQINRYFIYAGTPEGKEYRYARHYNWGDYENRQYSGGIDRHVVFDTIEEAIRVSHQRAMDSLERELKVRDEILNKKQTEITRTGEVIAIFKDAIENIEKINKSFKQQLLEK